MTTKKIEITVTATTVCPKCQIDIGIKGTYDLIKNQPTIDWVARELKNAISAAIGQCDGVHDLSNFPKI